MQELQCEMDAQWKAWMARKTATQDPLQCSEFGTTNTLEDVNIGRESINKPSDNEELEVQSGIEAIAD